MSGYPLLAAKTALPSLPPQGLESSGSMLYTTATKDLCTSASAGPAMRFYMTFH